MLKFLIRQPFAILGAISFISLLKDLMDLSYFQDIIAFPQNLLFIVNGFQTITHPIWEFLLGWFFDWLGWDLTSFWKNYFTIGAILAPAFTRAMFLINPINKSREVSPIRLLMIYGPHVLLYIPIWPVIVVQSALIAYVYFLHIRPESQKLDGVSERLISHSLNSDKYTKILAYAAVVPVAARVFSEFIFWTAIIIAVAYGLQYTPPTWLASLWS